MNKKLTDAIEQEFDNFTETVEALRTSITSHRGPAYFFKVAAMADLMSVINSLDEMTCSQFPAPYRVQVQEDTTKAVNSILSAMVGMELAPGTTGAMLANSKQILEAKEMGLWVRRLTEARRKSEAKVGKLVSDLMDKSRGEEGGHNHD